MRLLLRCLILAAECASAAACFASSATATSTSLTIAPGPTVAAGTVATLTATVTGSAVSSGFVAFCNASALYCEDGDLLGTATAQMVSATELSATLHLAMSVGAHDIKAVFVPTSSNLSSASQTHTLTVTAAPTYQSVTTLTASGSPGTYSLTGTVNSFGGQAIGGLVRFYDATSDNREAGTGSFDRSAWTFSAPTYLSSVSAPVTNVGADLNNDGKLDLISMIGSTTGKLSIFLGGGNGIFPVMTDYTVMANPSHVAVGDFNGDGSPDLVAVGGIASGEMDVLIGNGDGTFHLPVRYATDSDPSQVAVGDFNGDGKADVAVLFSTSTSGAVSILLGNGDGTFQSQTKYAVDQTPVSLATADFNRDGQLDLAVAYNVTPEVSIYLGNGDGTLRSRADYPMTAATNSIAVGDFNHDGNPDFVTNDSSSSIAVVLGNGDGTFRPKIDYPTSHAAEWFAIGDFNGDNSLDIAFTNGGVGTISFMYGNGDGSFQQLVDLNTTVTHYTLVPADLNSDGITDLIGGNYSGLFALFGEQIAHYTANGVSVVGTGTHEVFAQYPGDSARLSSQSSTVPLVASKVNTSISLYSNGSSAQYGDSVTLSALLSLVQDIEPTGTVTFLDNGTVIGTVPIASGAAAIKTDSLLVGTHTITCTYEGDQNYVGAISANFYQTIHRADAHLSVVSSTNPSVFGSGLTFTASVASGATGTVVFRDGSITLGTAMVNSGTASLTISTLPAGTHMITASYSGDMNYE